MFLSYYFLQPLPSRVDAFSFTGLNFIQKAFPISFPLVNYNVSSLFLLLSLQYLEDKACCVKSLFPGSSKFRPSRTTSLLLFEVINVAQKINGARKITYT